MPGSKSLTVLVAPSIGEAEKTVKEAVSHGKNLFVTGKCWVHYLGRAKSKLGPGERMLIVKSDGSLLVHRSTGYEPVNWMPGGDVVFNTLVRGGVLEVRALRKKPPETVRVFFDEVQLVVSMVLVDSGEFSLYASEEDMQRAILIRPGLLEEGFRPIMYEKRVEPGFVDVYGEDKDGRLVVVEIKRKTAGKAAALQLAKYIEAIRARTDRAVRGILVAPYVAKDVQRVLTTLGLEFRHMDPRKCAEIVSRAETKKLIDFFKKT